MDNFFLKIDYIFTDILFRFCSVFCRQSVV
nr:MAG TPA: hypothetical protein [Caudoviricetes sp.]DAY45619.1 MAG TPA: hypothetical protein [Caudoviricetes sp.]